jgi:hypothetical protein
VPVSYVEHPARARKAAPPAMPNSRGKLLITVRLTGGDSIFKFIFVIPVTLRNRCVKWAAFSTTGLSPVLRPASNESAYGLKRGNVTDDMLKNCSEFNGSSAANEDHGLS